MKKNKLFISALAGLGSVMALFAVFSNSGNSQYSPREEASDLAEKVNSDYFNTMRRNVNTGKVEALDYIKASEGVKELKMKNSRATSLNWDFAGPDNIGGRSRAIVVDNVNPNLIYAGGAGGGMYVSTDAAGTWSYKSTDWDNIQVSTIAQDGDGVLYAGTGMVTDGGQFGVGAAFPGGGIWTSSDRGETWSHIASTKPNSIGRGEQWAFVNRVAVSKSKNALGNYTVYAGTSRGLKVSLDKGLTWIEPMTLPNCSSVYPGSVQDVVTTVSGRVLIAYNGGLFVSDDGETTCSYTSVGLASGIGGSTRMSLTVCESDENMVYAFQGFSGDPATFKVLSSVDGGDTWGDLQPAPPTAVIDSTFDLMGSNPASYNQAIVVDPTDCGRIYVGAVEMYRVDGSWTSIAINFEVPDLYVHADKHWFTYSPHDPNTMYVGSDGGVGKTTNAADASVVWTDNNRHFGTTQYYGLSFSRDGHILAGAQDNGTHLIDPSLGGQAGKDGLEVLGGDGFDTEISNVSDVGFMTIYNGTVARGSMAGGTGGQIHTRDEANSPFNTILRLWESDNDLTSQDSVVFVNDSSMASIGTGDGVRKVFTGTLRRLQDAAKIVPGQVKFEDVAGVQIADDSDVNGVLKSFGDSVGTIDYTTGNYTLRWAFAPPVGSLVNSLFNVKFNAGDTLNLVSQNQAIPFTYVLPSALVVNDSIVAQDPVQSLLVVSMNGGFEITREALYFPLETPNWVGVQAVTPTCFEFSNDGNHLYLGSNSGRVMRISGLNNFYSDSDPDSVLIKRTIFNGSAPVSGINIHPTDPEKLLVTTGGYGVTNHVYELFAAQSATGVGSLRVLQGDLPEFPVYDPEYNVNNPNQVLIGTELGLWMSDDISGTSVAWTQQSGAMGNVPVLDVRQQRLPHYDAVNYGRFYIATFGRGIWTSSDLVGVDEPWVDFSRNTEIENLKMYPNPVNATSKLSFDMPINGSARIMIYDISGKLVKNDVRNFAKGTSVYEVNSADMPSGTYFVTVKMGSMTGNTKFVVVK
jgi:hypothetical protein